MVIAKKCLLIKNDHYTTTCNFQYPNMERNCLKTICLLTITLTSCSLGPDGTYVFGKGERVIPVTNQAYNDGCSECHFAYQPGLLPERSWNKLMEVAELEEHFGEYVEFEEIERKSLLTYLTAGSAETALGGLSLKILRSISGSETPLRITKTNYYTRKHEDIPEKEAVLNNDKVKSFANCNACHEDAETGVFIEAHDIPGYDGEHGH